MNPSTYTGTRKTRSSTAAPHIDWASQIRLAVILSSVTALAAVVLRGHVAETTFIVAAIVVASVASWTRVLRAPSVTRSSAHPR